MTVATAINRVQAIGDGSTTGFSFPHVFFADADLEVYLTVIATEVSTLQTLTAQYTVSGAGNPSGGTVTFITAPPATDRVTIIRVVAQTQGTDYQNASSFDQEVLEQDQDLAIMNIQQMQEELDRTPKQDVGVSPVTALAMPKPETGKSIGWDSGGQLVNQSSLPAATFSAGAGDALRPVRVNSAENGLEAHPGLSRPSKAISGTTVLTDSDEHYIVASGLAANINLKLPGTANVKRGDERIVINLDATFSVVIQASDIVVILTLPPGRNVTLMATQDAPTTPAHWAIPVTYLTDLTIGPDPTFQTGGTATHKGSGAITVDLAAITRAGVTGTLITYSIPADTLDSNGKILRFTCWGTKSGNTAIAVIQIRFAGAIQIQFTLEQNSTTWVKQFLYIRTASNQQDLVALNVSSDSSGWNAAGGAVEGRVQVAFVTDAETDTINISHDLNVSSINAGDTIIQEGLMVEVLN